MAECVKSVPDVIKSAYPIRVGVLCSQDADIISQRNNLSFAELIQPFCTLTTEAHVQGVGNQSNRAYNLNVRVSDINQHQSISENSTKNLLADLVQKAAPNENNLSQTVRFYSRGYDIEVNKSCLWFDIYRDLSIKYGNVQDHEFLNHHVACMIVVSSSNPNPLEEFTKLSQQQNHIQHNSKDKSFVRWMTPNTLKYYVLLHDTQQGNVEKAKAVYSDLQALYGMKVCHLLEINSRYNSTDGSELNLPDPWSKHMSFLPPTAVQTSKNDLVENKEGVNGVNGSWLAALEKSCFLSSKNGFGCCLSLSDHDRLRNFIQLFVTQGVIPYLEKTIKILHEQVNARKTIHRSFFRATRTLFGSKSSSSLNSITASYSPDANELNIRKLGDICFLVQLYEQAFQYYHSAKKDYTNDQAWLFAAGASEMAALSNFMHGSYQKVYPVHYMENAYNIYSDICKNDFLSLRCVLLHTACLQSKGFFNEAAFYLIKMTDEVDDLRSALLLEQAAHCFLKLKEPLPRKFSIYAILAGHRFSKCLQRQHSLRCYKQALQILNNKGWQLATDHINFTVARQSFNLRHINSAVDSFRSLITEKSRQPSSQQASTFEEFIHVFKQYLQENESLDEIQHACLALPKVIQEETRVVCYPLKKALENQELFSELQRKYLKLANNSLRQLYDYEDVNDVINIGNCFGNLTNNKKGPIICLGQVIQVVIVFKNFLNINIVLKNVTLLWKNDSSEVSCDPVEFSKIESLEKQEIVFTLKALKSGMLNLIGVTYEVGICDQDHEFSGTYYTVKDKQDLVIHGPRLNKSKEERCGCFYGEDNRLVFTVKDMLPLLNVTFGDYPEMLTDTVHETSLTFFNSGLQSIDTIKISTDDNIVFVIKSGNKFFSIKKQDPGKSIENILLKPLMPGEKMIYTCWVKAPSCAGDHRGDMLFHYFHNEKTTPLQRFVVAENIIHVKKGLSANKTIMSMGKNKSHVVSVSLRSDNDCIDQFYVNGLICTHKDWSISVIQQEKINGPISLGQTFTFHTVMKKNSSENPTKTVDYYNYLVDESEEYPTVLVQWSILKKETSKTNVVGQSCLNFKELAELKNPSEVLKDTVDIPLPSQNMHKLVHWRLEYNSEFFHNFNKCSLCYVAVELLLCNATNFNLSVVLNLGSVNTSQTNVSSESPFIWLGQSNGNHTLQPYATTRLKLIACFSAAGVYNINSLNVLAATERNQKDNILKVPQGPVCNYFITINKLQ